MSDNYYKALGEIVKLTHENTELRKNLAELERTLRMAIGAGRVTAPISNSCGRCGAATVESCSDKGCFFFENGNGAPQE
ncbi:hypothetical protein [Robertmurraya sp.]|uniref:hypothetical protein n=1 Tax=Robertmurraya sp. TaxID=2837525 RepID=UPI0037042A7A